MAADTDTLRVGITCYPSVGGSGVLATALGEDLAARGHDVHFIAYERPFRLPSDAPRLHFHPVAINEYGLFRFPDYTLPLSVRMAAVSREHRLDILHVHYAVPHATAAILARAMLPPGQQPRVVTTLHGTDTTLLGHDAGYAPAIHHALASSDAVTAVSESLKRETQRVLDFDGPIEVIHNFFAPRPPGRSPDSVRRELGLGDEVLVVHSSNLRHGKRVDLLANDHAVGQSETPHVAHERRERLAGQDEEPERVARLQARDGLQQEVDPLARAQVGGVHHEDLVAETELGADDLGRAAGPARGEEVVDDFDRAIKVENAPGFLLERLRYGGDRIRGGQRMLDGGRVSGIVAEQGRVGAVQGRDDTGLPARRQHRAREDRGGGVGHGVVDVQHVEAMFAAHLGHAHREGQGVVGVAEQLVLVDRDGMKVQAPRVRRQAERTLVRDEMHVVAARGELLAERCRQHAAAADRRVAGDADAQRVRRHVSPTAP